MFIKTNYMKNIILTLVCLLFLGNIFAQKRVDNFYSAMTTAPISNKKSVKRVIYKGFGSFDSIQNTIVYSKELPERSRTYYKEMGKIIDSLDFINYKSDTIYILTFYDVQFATDIKLFKNQDNYFYLERVNMQFKFSYQPKLATFESESDDYRDYDNYDDYFSNVKNSSAALLNKAIFNWDIDLLTGIIKSSGGVTGISFGYYAYKYVIKDYQVIEIDFITFSYSDIWILDGLPWCDKLPKDIKDRIK